MPRKAFWFCAGLLAAAALLTVPDAEAQQRALVLSGGTLIDGTGRAPITDAVIVAQGTRITAVGKRGQVQIPANAQVINLNGRTILPGLLDIHVHSKEWQYPMFTHYGVTTIADLDSDTAWIFAQRELTRNGRIKGIRMYVAGGKLYGPLRVPGGNPLPQNAVINRTVDQVKQHMRETEALGADYLKIDDTLTYEQLAAVIAEGKRSGLTVLGHSQNFKKAVGMGMVFDEHMDTIARSLLDPDATKYVAREGILWYPTRGGPVGLPQVASESLMNPADFPPLIAYLVQHGTYINPTMVGQWSAATPRGPQLRAEAAALSKEPGLAFVPAEERHVWTTPLERGERVGGYAPVAQFLRDYSKAGGKIVIGTDSSGGQTELPGLSEHYEMLMLADVGVAPMKIIQGATLWNAEAIGKAKEVGSVEVGKFADFLVIEGDPLKDISVTKNVRMVIKDGAVVDTTYDPKWVNPLPAPYTTLPVIRTIAPVMARQGGPAVTLTVEGSGFRPNSIVRLENADLPTQFVSANKLTATIGPQLLRKVGAFSLYVLTVGEGSNVSPGKSFLVNFKN